MDVNKTSLSHRQLRAIPHLIAAASVEGACKRARVSKATVYAWLKEEAFSEELRKQRQELSRVALERMKAGVGKATDTLLKHLDSDHDNISIRAAESIIAFAQKAFEHEEVEKRIEALEARIAETEQGRSRR